MEENQGETQAQEVQEAPSVQEPQSSGISFPTVGQPKKSNGKKTLLILGTLALIGVLGFFIFKNAKKSGEEITPIATLTPIATSSPTPTSTAKPADKSKVKIEIQNGTGIPGEAAFLQTKLKELGYTNIAVGNASSQNQTVTTVTFAKSLSADAVDEIGKKLKELYKEVEVKTTTTGAVDVLIVTGLRKGATAKPSATPTPKASATPTATGSPTASPTPTPTGP